MEQTRVIGENCKPCASRETARNTPFFAVLGELDVAESIHVAKKQRYTSKYLDRLW
jgi:hypothetical protein